MPKAKKKPAQAKKCVCPYCDVEIIQMKLPYCKDCGVVLRYCASCHVAVGPGVEVCPECGGKIE